VRKDQLELLLENLCGLIIQAQTLDIGEETTVKTEQWEAIEKLATKHILRM